VIVVRHTEDCAGAPNTSGRLTGKCDCKTAKLDEAARKQITRLLAKLAEDSIDAGELSEYFALRLDGLAEQIAKDARGVRRTAARADRAARIAGQQKREQRARDRQS
jgi:hypothetical protein